MKNKFLKNLSAVLSSLGWVKKAKDGDLTDEDWNKIASTYKEKFNSDFYNDQKEYESAMEKAQVHDSIKKLLDEANIKTEDGANGDGEGGENGASGEGADAGEGGEGGEGTEAGAQEPNLVAAVAALISQNKQTVAALRAVTERQEDDDPPTAEVVFNATGSGLQHSDTHLFGIENQIYNRERRWNQLFVNPGAIHNMEEAGKPVQDAFFGDFTQFATQVARGVNALHKSGMLNKDTLRSSANPDLTALTNAGLGDQFVQFRVRELVARVLELPDPFSIFPMRSGVQDRDLMTNAFVGELTQAWQDSETSLKGSSSLEPEMGYVDDAMILSKFGSFKDMERKYIAYLNTNGSDPVKWGMIEYFMLLYMMQARKEQFQRVVRGIYLKPVSGTAGHYLNASTGVVNRMFLYHIEKKLRGLEDATLATYDNTGTVMIDAVIEFGDWLKDNLDPLGVEVEQNVAVYLNRNHRQWFKKGYRSKYNLHGDFDGIEDTKIPDTDIEIVWVPNMGQMKVMWATMKGNMQCLENIPGEMFNFYMERRLNNVYVQSTWKEGTAAGFSGKKAASKTALDARDWDDQAIWFPKPYADLAADATTADAANGFWFKTVSNTGATAITTINNKKAGQLYIIETGNTTNATTIAKTGDFSEITATWTPTAVGDLLAVVWDAGAGKFKEVCRVVGGTLSYNSATTPNAIGAR